MNATRTLLAAMIALVLGSAEATPTIQATLPLGNNTAGIAIDPVLAQAYVTNFNDGTATVIDINSLTVQTTEVVGTSPRRLIIDAAHHRAYVVMDTTPGQLLIGETVGDAPVVYVPVGNDPRTLGSNFKINELYVSNFGSNTVSVINTTTKTVVDTISVGKGPLSPTSNDILKKLYVPSSTDNTISVIDETTHKVTKTLSVGKGPQYAAIDGLHGKVYVNNVVDKTVSIIDSATDTVVKTVPTGAGTTSNFGVISAVYHRYYLPNATDGTLTIINTDTDTVTHTVSVGTAPVDTLVDANGGDVYVVNQGSNSVSIINAATETTIGSFGVGGSPWRMADGLNHLFILNTNGASLDSVTITSEENTIANTAIATEFFHQDFNHYFHTADEVETRLILDGLFADNWNRTFQFFRVWTTPGPGHAPVCRFFSTAFGAKSSHFYTPYASECQKVQTDPALMSTWQLESSAVYYLALPDTSGKCPSNTAPLYRVYNNGQGGAPNHRYMGDRAVRDQSVAAGWTAEGNGPDIIFACTPTLTNG